MLPVGTKGHSRVLLFLLFLLWSWCACWWVRFYPGRTHYLYTWDTLVYLENRTAPRVYLEPRVLMKTGDVNLAVAHTCCIASVPGSEIGFFLCKGLVQSTERGEGKVHHILFSRVLAGSCSNCHIALPWGPLLSTHASETNCGTVAGR